MERNDKYAIMFAALCVGCAANEVLHVALDRPWPGFTALSSHIASVVVAVALTASALVVPLRARSPRWSTAAWIGDFAAPITCILHGMVVMGIGSSDLGGALYVLSGAILIGLGKRTWNGQMVALRASRPPHSRRFTPDAGAYPRPR